MDIKELDKRQLILLTLLITFVVSIATGIVTVSLMNQMPKTVPQTINNVIQRTIEKVTTIDAPANTKIDKTTNTSSVIGNGEALVPIYLNDTVVDTTSTATNEVNKENIKEIGQGIIISDVGLVLVDSSIITEGLSYKVVLNKIEFDSVVLKKFSNGFTVLKISEKKKVEDKNETNSEKDTLKTNTN